MLAGRLDRRVTLQRPANDRSAAGDVVREWETVAEVWAAKRDMPGREYWAAAATQAEIGTTFTIRYRDDLRTTWRLLYDGQVFNILDTSEIGRREGLDLRCVAQQDR